MSEPRIGILVVAYNAATTLAAVLDRIPVEFRSRISKIYVNDDHSDDATYLIGLGYQQTHQDLPLVINRHPRNLGYGGNQKAGYRQALDDGLDIVVLLHGDGQYAPEMLPEMVAPLVRGEADAVFGSRMLEKGAALRGGMPRYKYIGNKILTKYENAVLGTSLSEFHSGYRAYSTAALAAVPFEENSDGFDFDTEIIIQMHHTGRRIKEIPIPTYYGDEICRVDGLKYARDVVSDVTRYRLQQLGLGKAPVPPEERYQLKVAEGTSHHRLIEWLGQRTPGRVLDLGCAGGYLSLAAKELGHEVTGVDIEAFDGVKERVDAFVAADLDHGLPPTVAGPFETVLAGDVLEHLRRPDRLLDSLHSVLADGGRLFASVPNFGHWYPRVRVAAGAFGYDQHGILDQDHVRFFTRHGAEELFRNAGWAIVRRSSVGVPLERLTTRPASADGPHGTGPRSAKGRLLRWAHAAEGAAIAVRPTLFAYQLIYELEPARRPVSTAG
jgi:2-polyprenyl-3-methyl-5-hydroxy-6-metoxy-1,4-benzoquinol methylase